MPEPYRLFVGVDWAKEAHDMCVLDGERKILAQQKIEHSGQGIAEFAGLLLKLCAGQPETVAIGIETPRGAVVETLAERRFAVFSLNPKQMDRFRDRHT